MTVTIETLVTTDLEFARQLGQQLRVDSIRCSTSAGSGHPTSSMSAADLIAVLISRYLQYDWNKPKEPNNDHLIFSKGHASPLVYAMFKAVGAITDAEMMTFRKFGSRMQGHPTPAIRSWRRDRAGKRSTRPATTSSPTSPPSSTSIGSASGGKPSSAGTSTPTAGESRLSGAFRSSSTAMT